MCPVIAHVRYDVLATYFQLLVQNSAAAVTRAHDFPLGFDGSARDKWWARLVHVQPYGSMRVSIEQSTFSDTSIKAAIKALKRQVQAACREKGVMCTRRKALSLYAGGCILVINCRGDVRGDC